MLTPGISKALCCFSWSHLNVLRNAKLIEILAASRYSTLSMRKNKIKTFTKSNCCSCSQPMKFYSRLFCAIDAHVINRTLCFNNLTLRSHSSLHNSRNQKVVLSDTNVKSKLPVTGNGTDLGNKLEPSGKSNVLARLQDVRKAATPYLRLMRVDKPIGTWLLFWPCSWSIALAGISTGAPLDVLIKQMALFLTGSFIMRGAGCTINDLWDKDIDGKVVRTKDRPLVSGAVTERQAMLFLAAQLTAGLAVLLQLNWYSVLLGASSMGLVVTYPLAKRFTNYPQLFLGATFNWGALLGWTAVAGHLEPAVCLPLYAGALCWTVVYDTIYAHQDKADDARIGIKSTALTFGSHTKPLLALAGAGAALGLGGAGHVTGLHWPYYGALAAAALHVARQIYTLKTEVPDDCADKFKSNSLVGLIILTGIIAGGYSQYLERVDKKGKKS